MVQVNLGNKTFYLLLAFVVVAICAAVAYAVSPSVFGHTSSEITISCPTGFTLITNNSQTLGCMQNSARPAKEYYSALQDCWTNYGGRLPLFEEAYISFKYNLVTLPTSSEQTGEGINMPNYCTGLIGVGPDFLMVDYSRCNSYPYRCFIPA